MSSLSSPVVLSGSCDLSRLPEVRVQLLDAAGAASRSAMELDLEGVDAADVGLVQLLVSFHKTLQAEGRGLTLRLSDTVERLFSQAGVPVPGR